MSHHAIAIETTGCSRDPSSSQSSSRPHILMRCAAVYNTTTRSQDDGYISNNFLVLCLYHSLQQQQQQHHMIQHCIASPPPPPDTSLLAGPPLLSRFSSLSNATSPSINLKPFGLQHLLLLFSSKMKQKKTFRNLKMNGKHHFSICSWLFLKTNWEPNLWMDRKENWWHLNSEKRRWGKE